MQDPQDLALYYDSYYRPAGMLWLPFKGLNLSAGAGPAVVNAVWLPPDVAGDATPLLRPAPSPFEIQVGVLPPPCAAV